jgi:hypothetical protein
MLRASPRARVPRQPHLQGLMAFEGGAGTFYAHTRSLVHNQLQRRRRSCRISSNYVLVRVARLPTFAHDIDETALYAGST